MPGFSYNRALFDPPAPVIPVTLGLPVSSTRIDVQGQLDSGADMTFIRAQLASELNLAKVGEIRALTPTDDDDEPFVTPTYSVRLIVTDVFDAIVEVAAIPNLPEVELLIGRDIINNWDLHLLGPEMIGRIELP